LPGKHFQQRWPSPKTTKKIRRRVREFKNARKSGKEVKPIIAELNPVRRGWGNYLRTGNADREFHQLDRLVVRRLRRVQHRAAGRQKVGPTIN
jgi:RNA-directed DNA polymerase